MIVNSFDIAKFLEIALDAIDNEMSAAAAEAATNAADAAEQLVSAFSSFRDIATLAIESYGTHLASLRNSVTNATDNVALVDAAAAIVSAASSQEQLEQ